MILLRGLSILISGLSLVSVLIFLLHIPIACGSLDSPSTGISPIAQDLKIEPLIPQQTMADKVADDPITNRRRVLDKNCSLSQVINEDVMPSSKPNIVIMLSDNNGYMDLGCYGGGDVVGAPTPRLDQMANEGLRLTSFYSETQCTPTRAAIMTGRLPIRTGMTLALEPGLGLGLSPKEITLAKVLSDAGYDTAILGKWHLGDANKSMPQNMGFDYFWGSLYYANAYTQQERLGYDFNPPWDYELPGIIEAQKGSDWKEVQKLNLSTLGLIDEKITQKAVEFIRDHANSEKPFFLYLPWLRVHFPTVQNPRWAGKSSRGSFGDAMMELDYNCGMVLDAIKEYGIADNTIVVFLSDNGPTLDEWPDTGYSPFRGGIGTAYEGGIRVPCIFWWPGHIKAGSVSNEIMCSLDLFNTFATLGGGAMPDDRPIDGIDQTRFILGQQCNSNREWVAIFTGNETIPTALLWHQFKIHLLAYDTIDGPVSVYGQAPAVYNIEMDPREEHNIAEGHDFVIHSAFEIVKQLKNTMKSSPNTPVNSGLNWAEGLAGSSNS